MPELRLVADLYSREFKSYTALLRFFSGITPIRRQYVKVVAYGIPQKEYPTDEPGLPQWLTVGKDALYRPETMFPRFLKNMRNETERIFGSVDKPTKYAVQFYNSTRR